MLFVRKIVGDSMEPVLFSGRIALFVRKKDYSAGDIVLVRHNGLEKIKRIQKVDNKRVFLVGDNSKKSIDSRHFGWVGVERVIGKIFWPFAKKS